jgi:hypothetical protein
MIYPAPQITVADVNDRRFACLAGPGCLAPMHRVRLSVRARSATFV